MPVDADVLGANAGDDALGELNEVANTVRCGVSDCVRETKSRGAVLDEPGHAWDGKLALVELSNGDAAPSYVAGTGNFYAITRYNWSSYYAMAVIELGEAVRRQRR